MQWILVKERFLPTISTSADCLGLVEFKYLSKMLNIYIAISKLLISKQDEPSLKVQGLGGASETLPD